MDGENNFRLYKDFLSISSKVQAQTNTKVKVVLEKACRQHVTRKEYHNLFGYWAYSFVKAKIVEQGR